MYLKFEIFNKIRRVNCDESNLDKENWMVYENTKKIIEEKMNQIHYTKKNVHSRLLLFLKSNKNIFILKKRI